MPHSGHEVNFWWTEDSTIKKTLQFVKITLLFLKEICRKLLETSIGSSCISAWLYLFWDKPRTITPRKRQVGWVQAHIPPSSFVYRFPNLKNNKSNTFLELTRRLTQADGALRWSAVSCEVYTPGKGITGFSVLLSKFSHCVSTG